MISVVLENRRHGGVHIAAIVNKSRNVKKSETNTTKYKGEELKPREDKHKLIEKLT